MSRNILKNNIRSLIFGQEERTVFVDYLLLDRIFSLLELYYFLLLLIILFWTVACLFYLLFGFHYHLFDEGFGGFAFED